ncbi:hypothetical protein BOTBODRAFT_36653 [Botryobasidium botryosum FD-172 SS1]|uniref:F-box domain-containing protein n=1 Tax=Botryobasidium botryosum (strain FD-172 SS1) TaxID=930990 RepID=A0A067M2M9_BOTB1|nr:hypothetical protein BOTBODRAFT_36653 [Botryobasidium botryosum FD-172 SS1]
MRTLSLNHIPVEVLIESIFCYLAARDIQALSCCSSFLAGVCADDLLWKRLLLRDFNVRITHKIGVDLKSIHKGLQGDSRIFVWGVNENNIFWPPGPFATISEQDGDDRKVLSYPHAIEAGPQVAALEAGATLFCALDIEGKLHVWGNLSWTSFAPRCMGRASAPATLLMPNKIESVSCGRMHIAVVDALSNIWIFTSWESPYRLVCPELSNTSPETSAAQVEVGSYFVAVLTESAGVYATWPFCGPQRDFTLSPSEVSGAGLRVPDDWRQSGTFYDCELWDAHSRLLALPQLPDLPPLPLTGYGASLSPRITQIAAGNDFLVALTNHGHVLKIDLTGGQHANGLTKLQEKIAAGDLGWEYLPLFSTLDGYENLNNAPPFQAEPRSALGGPPVGRITRITANDRMFAAHSTGPGSIVLMGTKRTTSSTPPEFIPFHQSHFVISVTLGDNHFGALTSDGQLLTWGRAAFGALGLGDPHSLPADTPGGFSSNPACASLPDVKVPCPVRFDWEAEGSGTTAGKRQFCFAAAASGKQFAALVLSLDDRSS